MPHTYEIPTGYLYDPAGKLTGTGYAGGDKGQRPEGKNNPDMCNVPNVGPLPPGLYTMGEPVEHSQLGPFAIPLTPDPTNEMFGRRGFYVHGDKIGAPGSASDGCMILPRSVREALHNSPDQQIQVVKSRV